MPSSLLTTIDQVAACRRAYATSLPSGDNAGHRAPTTSFVSRSCAVPSVRATYTSDAGNSLTNATARFCGGATAVSDEAAPGAAPAESSTDIAASHPVRVRHRFDMVATRTVSD